MYIIQSSTKVPFNFHDFEKVYLMRRTIHLTSLLSSNLLFQHIQLYLFIGLYFYPMFTSLLYPRTITKRRSVSHWRRLLTVTVSVSLEARPGSDHRSRSRDLGLARCRGDNHDTMIYCGYHCSLHLRQTECPDKKNLFFHCHSCLETSLFGHHVQRWGRVWERTEKIKSSKIYKTSWINRNRKILISHFYSIHQLSLLNLELTFYFILYFISLIFREINVSKLNLNSPENLIESLSKIDITCL